MPLPIEIVGLGKSEVRFIWDESHESVFPVSDLRKRCSCAHCKEEMTGRSLLDPASVAPDIHVDSMELVGSYGVRIEFSDKHGTGIFRFQDLFDTCSCEVCRARREAGKPG